MENKLVEFLNLVYSATPSNILTSWGIARYNRFKTKCWKHLEETSDLFQFVNTYFASYDANLSTIIAFLEKQDNLLEMFRYLDENITILVGRLQFLRKQDSNEESITLPDSRDTEAPSPTD